MYESPKSSLGNEPETTNYLNYLKWVNLLFVMILYALALIRVLAWPSFEAEIGFRVFVFIIICLFSLPNLLAIRSFNSGYRKSTGAKVASITLCAFVLIGVVAQPQDIVVYISCGFMFFLSMVNLVSMFGKIGLVQPSANE